MLRVVDRKYCSLKSVSAQAGTIMRSSKVQQRMPMCLTPAFSCCSMQAVLSVQPAERLSFVHLT